MQAAKLHPRRYIGTQMAPPLGPRAGQRCGLGTLGTPVAYIYTLIHVVNTDAIVSQGLTLSFFSSSPSMMCNAEVQRQLFSSFLKTTCYIIETPPSFVLMLRVYTST